MQYYNSIKKLNISNRVIESQSSVKKQTIENSFLSPTKPDLKSNMGDSSSKSVGLRHLRMEGLSSTSGAKASKGNTGLKEKRKKIKGSLNIR